MRLRLSRGLSERPIPQGAENVALNREVVPVIREMTRAFTAAPTLFEWSGGEASLDVGAGRDFAASSPLTQSSTLTLTGGYAGAEGWIFVQQDAVGGWGVTAVADGWTILREDPFVDDNPASGAGELTRYHYTFITIAGSPYLVLERLPLL